MRYTMIIAASLAFLPHVVGVLTMERLWKKLMTNYTADVLPAANTTVPVQVHMSLRITKINELNTKEQFISISGWLTQEWNDSRLMWNPEEYDGATHIVLNPTTVWLPDTTLQNSVRSYYDSTHYGLHRVTVSHNGHMLWSPGGRFVTNCDIDVTFYPFDDQMCEFQFGTWAYTNDMVNVNYGKSAKHILLEKYRGDVEWDVVAVNVTRGVRYHDCCPDTGYSKVYFQLHLRRKPLFYIINTVTPTLMLSVLVLFVFVLPADSGERISMGMTLLLAFCVFLLLVSEEVPNTSLAVPLIQVYMASFMGITCLTVCLSVFVLYLHHKEGVRRPPAWLRHLVYALGRCLCKQVRQRKPYQAEPEPSPTLHGGQVNRPIDDPTMIHSPSSADSSLEHVTSQATTIENLRKEDKPKTNHDIVTEWKAIARIFDQVLFCVTLTAFVACNVAVFGIAYLRQRYDYFNITSSGPSQ